MSENSSHIAVIGLGAMGLPMATHLATKFSVTGFDPFEARRQLAAEQGIVAEATPRGASRNADIALLAVRDQSQAESALFGEEGVLESLRAGIAGDLDQHYRPGGCAGVGRTAGRSRIPARRRPDQWWPGPRRKGRPADRCRCDRGGAGGRPAGT